MAEAADNAKIKRTSIKGTLTRFSNYFNSVKELPATEINFRDLQLRLEKVEKLYDDFDNVQSIIEAADPNYTTNASTIHDKERASFENPFFSITGLARELLAKLSTPPAGQIFQSSTPSTSEGNISQQNIRLPTINLPSFEGDYDTWLFFRDTFNSIIHTNSELSNIQKFHYLRLSLKGIAADTIRNLDISDATYATAWSLLRERFENKPLLVNNHIKKLFNLPNISRNSHNDLRALLDGLQRHLRSLESLQIDITGWDPLIIYLVTTKLDNTSHREWEQSLKDNATNLPTLNELTEFLKGKCRVLESLNNHDDKLRTKAKSFVSTNNNSNTLNCSLCSQNHLIYSCPNFSKLQPTSRLNEAKRLKLCINCLRSGHPTKNCKSSGCRKCGKPHHTLLHFHNSIQNTPNLEASSSQTPSNQTTNSLTTHNHFASSSQILLSTVLIKVFDSKGNMHEARALLDSGSESNFITQRLLNTLKLHTTAIDFSVYGINQTNSVVHLKTSLTFKSNTINFTRTISCLVMPEITGRLPSVTLNRESLNIPSNVTLADPHFNVSSPIDILIGADTFWDLLCVGQIKLSHGQPTLHKTKLGWIVSGPIPFLSRNKTNCHFSSNRNLENQLQKFWELEEFPRTKFFSEEELQCEKHFKETTSFDSTGRFIVSLPLKLPLSNLGNSEISATKRFFSLEKKLNSNPTLKADYIQFISEYSSLNHMSKLPPNLVSHPDFFLPHHCVYKGNKIRVVFDGSAKTDTGFSLNDILMVGPTLQDDLFTIILRFRKHKFALTADIVKMYRQILIKENQRCLQKILWRSDPNSSIETYTLNTVTYGTASASFLATRCVQEVAHIYSDKFPDISSIILRDFYVDDLHTGASTLDELKRIQSLTTELLSKHGFHLSKWKSNSTELKIDNIDNTPLDIGSNETVKTLGLFWNPKLDVFFFNVQPTANNSRITKRHILSAISKIFDPLGLLAAVTITAKIILQDLWRLKISWDEVVPMNIHTKWSNYQSQLVNLNKLQFPRYITVSNFTSIQLHGFSDASTAAYGACIFIRSLDAQGNISCYLLCAKTRVAPLKHILTVPRLELSGALLLSELVDKVKQSLQINFDEIVYWCDSNIVLAWINTSPNLLKPFVANRISQIQSLTNSNSWRYINTQENPADLLSRGISPTALQNSDLWFHGPPWLLLSENLWPHQPFKQVKIPELRSSVNLSVRICMNLDIIYKISSLTKLQRIVAYILRFCKNSRLTMPERTFTNLTCEEIACSLICLIRIVQNQSFSDDFTHLKKHGKVDHKSKLLTLNPFLDQDDIIRVGGRIHNADISYERKHPIVIPQKHHFTDILVRHEHMKLQHAGPQLLLSSLREKYWPLNGRYVVRKVVRNCITCFKAAPKLETYLMGNLPSSRLTPSRPFTHSGLDYAGPFLLKDRLTRNYKTIKGYVALFICLATKAIHLEVVSSLTTECFIAALRRFTSRRGKCASILSDNGSTFKGANNELSNFLKTNNSAIHDRLSSEGIDWKFIPPRSPHFGGIWEAGVKSVKYHLKRVISNTVLSYEEFSTVLIQIEAILNSRPLFPMSNDPSDLLPLTPAHFLVGSPLTSVPDRNLLDVMENRLSRFQRVQQMVQCYWTRWSKEYVSSLQQRVKWKKQCSSLLKIGSLVLVKEDGLEPLRWTLGRVIDIHAGSDGIVRSVTLKTNSGVYKRPVVKLCVLPNENQL
ncbi:uncharacterized protein [Diabrotica undecimpunctata]|uniref:uncharacterized protein n=1 Tax=Diabrotica undecimpunctata TaxID=50387 RepID=UPI003B640A1D